VKAAGKVMVKQFNGGEISLSAKNVKRRQAFKKSY
jgi:hypothetical protein